MQQVAAKAFSQYQSELLAFIGRKVSHKEDAQDILSAVFVKLLQQNDAPDSPIAWLYQVTKNTIIDYYRTRRPNDELPQDLVADSKEESAFSEMSVCMKPMVMALDERYRDVLLLSDIEGMKQKAVAERLNLSLSAVKSRVLRGRELLATSLVSCCAPVVNAKGKVDDFLPPKNRCGKC
ncbi:sigma-70 family RNA polymerase sigma factor [Shewanella psychropiezotolerans]|uniref:Sigma-70 family RNA polymerase sigma factor n=1 Tax=Shewanella psychropiezotolerans TaxID=2593655 RepID=A0ABX5X2K4_9GAMM|nr:MULTISPECIES: sigma-70 family RNA polymerase sigma factor [Shewanella]MPY23433.1 sigma-70 family RNA polymerase sigma factor [Shewanella sp. YLB-07]QDO85514.1 sigma-70 family RNA polymerase sigma factor [Shewanella psychropiezotolerans]